MRRIGLFGGTFDPPHLGHLALAEIAREQLGLERVIFVPSGTPPHKRGRAIAPARHRLAMTRLAARGNDGFEVSAVETRRRGASYTIDTLTAVADAERGARLYLVIGEDSLRDFPTWHDPRAIAALATLAVAPRLLAAGPPLARRVRARTVRLEAPRLEISSSTVRERLRRRRTVRYLVPERVLAYIERHGLYRGTR